MMLRTLLLAAAVPPRADDDDTLRHVLRQLRVTAAS
jgi:hypothetical protein